MAARAAWVFSVFFGLFIGLLWTGPAAGQEFCPTLGCDWNQEHGEAREVRHLKYAGVNALLGGFTSGIVSLVKGEDFKRAFAVGAVAGAVTYSGKAVSAQEFTGGGFAGRQLASLGGSVLRNSISGHDLFEEIVLVAGPVRFYVQPGSSGWAVQPKVDLAAIVAAAYMVMQNETRFDLASSMSAGALVLRRDGSPGYASSGAGVVLLATEHEGYEITHELLFAHERVHVAQYDQAFLSWSEPVEGRLMRTSRWGTAVHRWVDVGAIAGLQALVNSKTEYRWRPWEREAYFLTEPLAERLLEATLNR